MESKALVPVSVQEVAAVAKSVVASGLFPAMKNEQSALVLMLLCQAEGLHPIQAVRRFDVIDGKPAKKSDAMLADYMAAGGKVTWLTVDATACEAEFAAPSLGAPVRVRWTYEMAKAAGLTGKRNWQQYPRQMLRARVVSEGIRMAMPAVVAGIYAPEEVQDFEPAPESRKPRVVIETTAEKVETAPAAPTPESKETLVPSTPAQRSRLIETLKRAGLGEKKQLSEWARQYLTRSVSGLSGCWASEIADLQAHADELLRQHLEAQAPSKTEPMPEWAEPAQVREPGEEG